MSDLQTELGRRLRRIRKSAVNPSTGEVGLTQKELAELGGMAQGYISALERGDGWVSVGKVGDMLGRAGLNPLDLISEVSTNPEVSRIVELLEHAPIDLLLMIRMLLERESRSNSNGENGGTSVAG